MTPPEPECRPTKNSGGWDRWNHCLGPDGEELDGDEAEPERGQGEPEEGQAGERVVERRVLAQRRVDADRDRDERREQHAPHDQLGGVPQRPPDLGRDGFVGALAGAPVAAHEPAEPGPVLLDEGLVEAEVLAFLADRGRRGAGLAELGGRVEGGPDEREGQERGDEDHRDRVQDAPPDVAHHGAGSGAGGSGSTISRPATGSGSRTWRRPGCRRRRRGSRLFQMARFGSGSRGRVTCWAAMIRSAAFEALTRAASLVLVSTVSRSGSRVGMLVRVQFSPELPFDAAGMFWEHRTVQRPGVEVGGDLGVEAHLERAGGQHGAEQGVGVGVLDRHREPGGVQLGLEDLLGELAALVAGGGLDRERGAVGRSSARCRRTSPSRRRS